MTNFEVLFSGIDFIDFSIFLFVKLKSEFVLFLGSEAESEFLSVMNEVILKDRECLIV